MADTKPSAARRPPLDWTALSRRAARTLLHLLRRGYALALIVLIFGVSYGAIRFLVDSLIRPSHTPQQIAGVPRRLDQALLQGSRPDWLGLGAVDNPRAPLSHYHRFETWIEPDRFNDCTRSGCHAPLPHTRRKEVRAFLNMHATSIHCGVCHMQSESAPLPLVWYDLQTGDAALPPALLRAFGWLSGRPADATDTRAQQREIAGLLRSAAHQAQGDPALLRVATRVETARPGTENFRQALDEAQDAVRRAFRGSYGAKLALRDAAGRPIQGHPNADAPTREWLASGASKTGPRRDDLLKAIHPLRREMARQCANCHIEQGSLIDFARLGYPPARVRALHESRIFQMIQHIGEGRPFYLPSFEASTPLPTSMPASTPSQP